jgi:DNA-binding NarL/FixJ family response regulator
MEERRFGVRPVTLVIADDHQILREGIKAILEKESSIKVIGEAHDGQHAIKVVTELRPQVVLMDLNMPIFDGTVAIKQIMKAVPSTKILVLTGYDLEKPFTLSMENGAIGYLLKGPTTGAELVKAIHVIAKGESCFTSSIAKLMRQIASSRNGLAKYRESSLTDREIEVVQLIAQGFSNKQIAGQLSISVKTVEKHRQGCMDKLNIHDIAGLTRYVAGTFNEKGNEHKLQPSNGHVNGHPSLVEMAILSHLGRGLSHEQIAVELDRAVDEIKATEDSLKSRLNLSSRAQLKHYAIDEGLVA